MILIVIMTKSVTTKIDDETYEKLVEKCTSSKENRCQYLKRMIESSLADENILNIQDNPKFKNITKLDDNTWKTKDGVIIREIKN